MSSKVVKVVALPVVLGFASIRVYAVRESKPEGLMSPRELTIYSSLPQNTRQYVEEQPGVLQRGLGKVRETIQGCILNINHAFVSVKVTAVNLYHGGEDIYHFLKDPPPGFVPRATVITVSGLAGVILARKGSRLKKLGLPLSLATAGFAMCYPVQTIAMLKVSGKKMYAATRWTSSTVASLWESGTPAAKQTQDARSQETSPEDSCPSKPSLTSMPDEQTAPEPISVSVLGQASETKYDIPSTRLLMEAADEKPTSSSPSASTESQPEATSLQLPEDVTPAVTLQKQHHGADPKLMDFGQSNPEDADLYSTRS